MNTMEAEQLLQQYGDISLSVLVRNIKGNRKFTCPKCSGTGKLEYNNYPNGLPDSGFVYEAAFKNCDLCEGHGITEDEYETKTKVVGYIKK